jgi:hypothetical protein
MEDDLQWKMTSNGRQPQMEDDFQWKTTSTGRQPPIEDTLQWKISSNGRRPPMEDDLKILKGEHIFKHLLDLLQLLNLSILDQTTMENC